MRREIVALGNSCEKLPCPPQQKTISHPICAGCIQLTDLFQRDFMLGSSQRAVQGEGFASILGLAESMQGKTRMSLGSWKTTPNCTRGGIEYPGCSSVPSFGDWGHGCRSSMGQEKGHQPWWERWHRGSIKKQVSLEAFLTTGGHRSACPTNHLQTLLFVLRKQAEGLLPQRVLWICSPC